MDSKQFIRYLEAKKTVDDRALNRTVWQTMLATLPPQSAETPLRVLEIGGGIGTMVKRMAAWGALTHAAYTLVDAEAANIAAAQRRLAGFGQTNIALELVTDDLFAYCARAAGYKNWNLLVAHAVLDLLDVPTALPQLLACLTDGGVFYFTINFDGATIFEPVIDPALDAQIEHLYHRSMDARMTNGKPSGDSQAGRHLIHQLRAAGTTVLAAGSSDWVVFAGKDGYSADEAFFLHTIIDMIYAELKGCTELNGVQFAQWIETRRRQIDNGELVYIAHQLDVVGRK